jgi:hypothetical protein
MKKVLVVAVLALVLSACQQKQIDKDVGAPEADPRQGTRMDPHPEDYADPVVDEETASAQEAAASRDTAPVE